MKIFQKFLGKGKKRIFNFSKPSLKNDIDAAVYRVVQINDYNGYSISAEFSGCVEITHYDSGGKAISRTYGNVPKNPYKRFKFQVCPIKEIYLISKYVNFDNAAVIMCSSYPIDAEKSNVIKNKLCLYFDDTTNVKLPSAFNIDTAKKVKAYIDALDANILDANIKVIYVCSDGGESRNAALCAAIMRYLKMSDKEIWDNPYYHPNTLVYELQYKVFDIFALDCELLSE